MIDDLKVAIVHDFLTANGGAERVVMALHELFPNAPIYTLRYDAEKTHGQFNGCDIHVAKLGQSWLGRSATLSLPFLPNAVETLDLSSYDLVISSSAAYAKGVITRPETLHICYCHTPMRYAWDWTHEYARERGYDRGGKSVLHRLITHYLRLWDQASAQRVDVWIANSKNVARRILKYYHQKSTVIYPPVVISPEITLTERPVDEPYLLIVSRLSGYKKIDLAIQASAATKMPLVIIGEGVERQRLEELISRLNAPVALLGYQSDAVIAQYYQHSRGFIFAGEDDFGITPVEAMSFGKPVIAYSKGGALETVIEGKTGLFFDQPTVESLIATLKEFEKKETSFKPDAIKKQAEQFSADNFKVTIGHFITDQWQQFQEKSHHGKD